KHERIFERFFQNNLPGSMLNQGSGIGLAITTEFVNMQQGRIFVDSESEHGSCFIIQLPVLETADEAGEDSMDNGQLEEIEQVDNRDEGASTSKISKKQTILLVEDNDDFRFYLKDNLKETYHIIEAVNGKEGWQK